MEIDVNFPLDITLWCDTTPVLVVCHLNQVPISRVGAVLCLYLSNSYGARSYICMSTALDRLSSHENIGRGSELMEG